MPSLKPTVKSHLLIQEVNPFNAEVTSPVNLRIINNEKGRSLFLNSTESVNTVAFLEFVPDAEIRGNHYHLHKSETLYVIDGKMMLYYWFPGETDIGEVLLEKGHLVTIKPKLAHAYKAIEKTLAFEMGTHPYDPADTIYDYRIQSPMTASSSKAH